MKNLYFIKTHDSNSNLRAKKIIKTGIIGIVVNILLVAFKAVIGILTNSIAIMLDAVNNLSDAGSSLITIVGTKLAGKEPDREHPFGHGRIEYLSAMIISVMVTYAGIASLIESIKKIINPIIPKYTTPSLIIIGVAVVVKIVLGFYVKAIGVKVRSDALINSGQDAKLDAVISTSTLVAAGIFIAFKISLEAWLGSIISSIIIKSGVGMLANTISNLLGEKNDLELVNGIKRTVKSFPGVEGVYDLVLNNYGPDAWNGSLHIEVPDTYTADKLDQIIREIQVKVHQEHQVIINAIGVYSINTKDPKVKEMQQKVKEIVLSHKNVNQLHGFYFNAEKKTMRFDIVISLNAKDRLNVFDEAISDVKKNFPGYTIQAFPDTDFAEE